MSNAFNEFRRNPEGYQTVDQMNWLELLPGAVAAINATPTESLKMSPFELETGIPFRRPVDTQILAGQELQTQAVNHN